MGYYNDYFYSGQEKTTQKNKYRAKFSERSTFRRRIICVIIKQIPKTEGKMKIKKLKTIATSIVLAMILSATACNGKTECSHNYVIDETASVAATCENGGKTVEKCTECGKTKTENLSPLGHTYGEWGEKTPATCENPQILERKCTRSGCEKTEEKEGTPKLGHAYGNWTEENGKLVRRCARAGCAGYEEKDAPAVRVFNMPNATQFTSTAMEYLSAENADISDYVGETNDGIQGFNVRWRNTFENVSACKVVYSENADFTDAISVNAESGATSCAIYNLKKATTYYLKVVVTTEYGEKESNAINFSTIDKGPRVMKIDGIHNVRDLGGYRTAGGRTLQGLIYRGGALSPDNAYYPNVQLTEAGKKYMSETLKIKTDFDLRNAAQNKGLTESPIPNAVLEYYNADGYDTGIAQKETYGKIFAALSDKSRYPVYLHCTGGADRTGTVSFLFNALLGVSEKELIQDYEYTSFSTYGERNSKGGEYSFDKLLAAIKAYDGETLAEKVENYLLSAGVTATQIHNIKAIMLGKDTEEEEKPTYKQGFDFSKGDITLDSSVPRATGNVIGYDGAVAAVKIAETSDVNGGTYIFIGSYGFYIRGGTARVAYRNGDKFEQVWSAENGYEHAGNINQSCLIAGATLRLNAKIKDETTITLTLWLNGAIVCGYDFTRRSDEVPAENAKFEIEIAQGASAAVLSAAE